MKCLYQEFMRRKKENWRVEFSEDMRIRFIESGMMLTSEETRFFREMKSKYEAHQKNKKKELHRKFSYIRESEENTDYSTSEEFRKLLENLEDTTSTDDEHGEDNQTAEPPYKTLPDILRDINENDYMKFEASSEEDDDEEPCSTQQAWDRMERYRNLRETDAISGIEETVKDSRGICKSYRQQRFPIRKRKLRASKIIVSRNPVQEEKLLTAMTTGRCPNNNGATGSNKFKRLAYNQMSPTRVICCFLCRLLISSQLQEESFMLQCNCSEVFVHTECALLYQTELDRQKCSDCKQHYYRDITSGKSAQDFHHRRDKMMLKRTLKASVRCRLPVEYETNCFICYDSRKVRDDSYEQLDSTIVRACRCNVTAHNECLVKLLLSRRTCRYCDHRFQMNSIGPSLGYFHKHIVSIYGAQVALTIIMGTVLVLLTSHYIEIANTTINMIAKNICVALNLMASTYLVIQILRVWKKKSRKIDLKSAVLVKPYESPARTLTLNFKKANNVRFNYEEIPFKEMEKSYLRRTINL